MAKKKPIDDISLKAIVDAEMHQALGYLTGKLSNERYKSEYYYRGEAIGDLAPPGIPGRSKAVSTDVMETIEGVMPRLMKIFCGSETAVEFTATRPNDEQNAKLATDYMNYLFYKKNNGYNTLYTAFKDALLQKNGIVKVWWDTSNVEEREEYSALTDIELTMLLQDPDVELIEHTAYPDPNAPPPMPPQPGQPPMPEQPMLHDVAVKRVISRGSIRIEPVPPEEFIMSRRGKSIDDTPFCAHRTLRTISELNSMGYKGTETLASNDMMTLNQERIERLSYDDDFPNIENIQGNGDPSSRTVWVNECYLQVDVDGDGIAEWRKVVLVGNVLLGDPETGETSVECDGPPFADFKPILMPHRFTGLSLADLAMPSQRERTALKRALLDNLNLQVNGRTIAVEGQVNIDDLLTNRPGGIVRVKTPGAVQPLQQGLGDAAGAYQMLEYSLTERENRTGFTRYSQGQSADTLNQSATGINIITNRSDERVELIARTFAETGMKHLFLRMLKLVSQHQDQPQNILLAGGWKSINPREWKNQFDFTVNVGLGTGNKDQQVAHSSALIQQLMMPMALQMGITKPQGLYEAYTKFVEGLGFGKNIDQILADPSKQPPPPPPPPDPKIQLEQQKLQQQMQIEQQKAQLEVQKMQAELQMEREKIAMVAKQKASDPDDSQEQDWAHHIEAMLLQIGDMMTAAASPKKLIRDESGNPVGATPAPQHDPVLMQLSDAVHQAKGHLEAKRQAKALLESESDDDWKQRIEAMLMRLGELAKQASAPKRVVRDMEGKVVGVQSEAQL